MVRSNARALRALAVGVGAVLMLAACSPGASSQPSGAASAGASSAASEGPQAGGTIYVLNEGEQWNHVDPQRAYTGEDLAFFGSTIYRSLVGYTFSADEKEWTTLVPDLATDTGTANADSTSWSFTLKDGVTWQDGSPITCEDVKYGVSRTFANDVISEGPTYAVQYLDIPGNPITDKADPKSVFLSAYYGPYDKTGQELYDKAVTCDGNTITFNLGGPHPDFNYTTTLGFSPVPEAADTGETYGTVAPFAVSSGPYQVESYTTGNGGKMVLVRNPNWDPATDGYRKALPDRWEVHFGIAAAVIDQRLMESNGNDAFGVQYGQVEPENLAVVFADAETPTPEFEGRAVSGFDPYSRYYWINVNKVSNVKIRQAMAVALDREAIRLNIGGAFAGEFADGVIKPNIGVDYAETGFWTDFFGQAVPDTGDPELAKTLIADSGEAAPTLVFNFPDNPTNARTAAIVISSLGKAGITVTPAPIEPGKYYSVVFDPETSGDFGTGGWGADWPNASTVIPPLFTQLGGWDLSQLDDPDLNTRVQEALAEPDRPTQAGLWQALNQEASENVWVIPTFFGRSQTITGNKIGGVYRWPAYGSWPYADMYVKP